jgi:hypothetical protein
MKAKKWHTVGTVLNSKEKPPSGLVQALQENMAGLN